MIRAVIFDMYETLITHYRSPLYFSPQMAADAGIPEEDFKVIWNKTEDDRTLGKLTFEDVIMMILKGNNCYSEILFKKIIEKRIAAKEECFRQIHSEIIPMLNSLKEKGLLVGLISNCFSEEASVIRKSILFPYFDGVCLSCELGIKKPDEKIFIKCMDDLSVNTKECIYVGDGGSCELETAKRLGMMAVQAVWYINDEVSPYKRNPYFMQLEKPLDIIKLIYQKSL